MRTKICSTVSLTLTFCFLCGSPALGSNWVSLFDGVSFGGWTTQNGESVEAGAWEIVDGMIHLDTSQGRGGNIITARDYGDFEMVFEWKVAAGANNGIKYRVKDFAGRVLGLEYQIIDDARQDLRPTQRTASLYDVYEPLSHNVLRPAGEFNRGRIVVVGNRIEHWLNGHLVVDAQVDSPDWQQRIAESKFADVEGFGANRLGRIMLTDHRDEVWYRNVFVRELTCDPHVTVTATQSTRARYGNRVFRHRLFRGLLRRRCR